MNSKNCLRYAQALALGLVTLAVAATPSFAQNLVALEATATMPDGIVIPMWGYFTDTGQACDALPAWSVGPQLDATADGTVTITLRNCLSEDISIFIPGQAKSTTPVTFTDGQGRSRVSSFDAVTAPNTTNTYTWTNVRTGTFMYHSGTHPQVQVQMGLYGVLAVDAYPVEKTVVFSEIDPALHAAVAAGDYGPDLGVTSTFDYKPKYYLINGEAYPDGSDFLVGTSESTVFRFVNAGLQNRVPTLQGLYMTLLAEDGFAYPEPMEQYSVLLAPGKTIDAAITSGADGTFALYDRALALNNAGAPGGGMLTYIVAEVVAGAPIAADDAYSVAEGDSLTADGNLTNPAGVLDNDTVTAPATAALVSGPSAGTLSAGLAADGSFTYTPNQYFNGTDLFTYTASDINGVSNVATVSITVTPVNNAPTALADAYTAPQGGTLSVAAPGVLGNDSDVDGDTLTATALTAPPAGSVLTLNQNGSFDYTPAGLADAIETFDYQACDPSLECATATVTITVGAPPANIAPIAYNVNAQTKRNTPVTFSVTFNDEDPDGTIDVASVDLNPGLAGRQTTVITQRGGTATVTIDDDGHVTFTPKNGFRGTDLFTYTVNDLEGATSNIATVRINVKK